MMWKIADGIEERLYDEDDICTYIYMLYIYIYKAKKIEAGG